MPETTNEPLARTVARQRIALTVLTGLLGLAAGLGFDSARPTEPAAAVQYVAGDDRIYRITESGQIDVLIVDFANGSVDGIPGWARLYVDRSLTRDRMGNVKRGDGS